MTVSKLGQRTCIDCEYTWNKNFMQDIYSGNILNSVIVYIPQFNIVMQRKGMIAVFETQ